VSAVTPEGFSTASISTFARSRQGPRIVVSSRRMTGLLRELGSHVGM